MGINREDLISYVKNKVDKKRFTHSVNTAKEAVELAKRYGSDEDKAYLAGLLHDVAKGMSGSELLNMANKKNIEADVYELANPELLHGKVGAAMAAEDLGINDTDILNAISWHTTGHANMSLLEKIIYIADIIEPARKFEDIQVIRKLAYEDIDAAMALGLEKVMGFVKRKGFSLHPKSIEAFENFRELEGKKEFEVQ